MYTLLLNNQWDIQLDANGNIATTNGAYAIAQNCANAVRLYTNDAYFDRQRGIPHKQVELGNKATVSRSVLTNRIKKACLAVTGVISAEVILEYDEQTRTYGGEVVITTDTDTKVRIEL